MDNQKVRISKLYSRMSVWEVGFFVLIGAAVVVSICALWRAVLYTSDVQLGATVGELLLVVVLGLGEMVAFFGLRHAASERAFTCWQRAQALWTEPTFVQQRGKLFQRLDDGDMNFEPAELAEARDVCRKMDEFSWLAPFLGVKRMLDVWDDPLAKAWIVLGPVVDQEQQAVHWSLKWKAFREIGQLALDKVTREGRDPRSRRKVAA